MNRDQIRGAGRHLKGRAQTAVGAVAGDPSRQVRGAANQVAGGALYAYGRARERSEDLADEGRDLARAARERTEALVEDGRDYAMQARRRGTEYGRRAAGYADRNRAGTLIGVAALAFAAGFVARRGA